MNGVSGYSIVCLDWPRAAGPGSNRNASQIMSTRATTAPWVASGSDFTAGGEGTASVVVCELLDTGQFPLKERVL